MYLEVWEPCARCGGVGCVVSRSALAQHRRVMRNGVVVEEPDERVDCYACNRFGGGDHPGYVRRLIPLAEALAAGSQERKG